MYCNREILCDLFSLIKACFLIYLLTFLGGFLVRVLKLPNPSIYIAIFDILLLTIGFTCVGLRKRPRKLLYFFVLSLMLWLSNLWMVIYSYLPFHFWLINYIYIIIAMFVGLFISHNLIKIPCLKTWSIFKKNEDCDYLKLIEEHKKTCLFYLKLDFSILVFVGAVLTFLDLHKQVKFEFLIHWEDFFTGLFFLILTTLIFERLISGSWEGSNRFLGKQRMISTITWILITILVIIHLIFFVHHLILGKEFLKGYFCGYSDRKNEASYNVFSRKPEQHKIEDIRK